MLDYECFSLHAHFSRVVPTFEYLPHFGMLDKPLIGLISHVYCQELFCEILEFRIQRNEGQIRLNETTEMDGGFFSKIVIGYDLLRHDRQPTFNICSQIRKIGMLGFPSLGWSLNSCFFVDNHRERKIALWSAQFALTFLPKVDVIVEQGLICLLDASAMR